jgi:hypothetical protein
LAGKRINRLTDVKNCGNITYWEIERKEGRCSDE